MVFLVLVDRGVSFGVSESCLRFLLALIDEYGRQKKVPLYS
jgi:hypothetical protein